MNPQEREVIGGIFDKLRQAESQPRDPQAEAFIAERIRQQPYAPYVMAQAIYMQEQALTNLTQQVEMLQQQVYQLQTQPPQQQSGGFFSSLFGGGRPQPQPQPMAQRPMGPPPGYGQPGAPMGMQPGMQQQPGPWGNQGAMQQPQQRGGMGFLGTAAAAAVGVAGGMMLANALQGSMGSNGQQTAAAEPAAAPEQAASAGGDQGWGQDSQSYDSGADWGGGGGDFNADDI